jgi:hypothetical protein
VGVVSYCVGAQTRAGDLVGDAEFVCDTVHARDLSRTDRPRERKRAASSTAQGSE